MGRVRMAWLTAALLVLAVLAGCSKTQSPAEHGASKQEPAAASLALRAVEGQKVSYKTTVKSTFSGRSVNGQALPAAIPLAGKTVMEYDADLHFERVAGTEATISYALSGFKVETEVGGKPLPATVPPGDMRFTMKLDTATGKLIDINLGPEFSGLLDKEQLLPLLEKMFAQWPQGTNPKPGATWTVETALPLDLQIAQGESKITVTTAYEGNESRNGVQVAKLVSTGSGPVSLSGESQGVTFTVKGAIEVKGVQYINLQTGLQESVESQSSFKFTQSMKEQKSGISLDTEMESTSEISMVRK